MKRHPSKPNYTTEDEDNYKRLLIKANVLHQNFDPKNPYPRSGQGTKWKRLLSDIWENKKKSIRERGSLLFRAILMRC